MHLNGFHPFLLTKKPAGLALRTSEYKNSTAMPCKPTGVQSARLLVRQSNPAGDASPADSPDAYEIASTNAKTDDKHTPPLNLPSS
jgi:hypothetical protein